MRVGMSATVVTNDRKQTRVTHRAPGRPAALALCRLLAAASALVASSAQAQTPACDMLKNNLAARIDPSIRGFTLETVAGDAPVPPGAKVIGTCEVNAYKILFRRVGDTRPAPFGGNAPASAPTPAPKPPAPAQVPAPSPPPPPAPAPVVKPAVTPASSPSVAPPPAPRPEPEKASVNEVLPTRSTAPAAAEPTAPTQLDTAAATAEEASTQRGGFFTRHWRWLVPLVSTPLLVWAWLWYVRRRDYDEAGLPRGPRL